MVEPLKPARGGFLRPFDYGTGQGYQNRRETSPTGKTPIDPDNINSLAERYLDRMSYKAQGCRFHSFITYFSTIQRLGWVEPTGKEEPSAFQEHYQAAQPRKFFRLTKAGKTANDAAWVNPQATLYSKS